MFEFITRSDGKAHRSKKQFLCHGLTMIKIPIWSSTVDDIDYIIFFVVVVVDDNEFQFSPGTKAGVWNKINRFRIVNVIFKIWQLSSIIDFHAYLPIQTHAHKSHTVHIDWNCQNRKQKTKKKPNKMK